MLGLTFAAAAADAVATPAKMSRPASTGKRIAVLTPNSLFNLTPPLSWGLLHHQSSGSLDSFVGIPPLIPCHFFVCQLSAAVGTLGGPYRSIPCARELIARYHLPRLHAPDRRPHARPDLRRRPPARSDGLWRLGLEARPA